MRPIQKVLLLLCLATISGCERGPTELRLIKPAAPIDAAIAEDIVELLGNEAEVMIGLTNKGQSGESALDALVAGEADLALVPNNMPFRSGVSTVAPMYPTVLHIGYLGKREFETNIDLFKVKGSRISKEKQESVVSRIIKEDAVPACEKYYVCNRVCPKEVMPGTSIKNIRDNWMNE